MAQERTEEQGGPASGAARKPKVCILQYNSSRFLTRVDRAARTLADNGYEVVLIAIKDDETEEFEQRDGYVVRRVPIASRGLPRRYGLKFIRFAEGIWRTFTAAAREDADVYNARDAYPLLAAHLAAVLRGSRVVYDADELATGRNWTVTANPLWMWAMKRYESFFARRSAVITSDHGRADVMEHLYAIPRPTVVLNVPERISHLSPDPDFRARALGDGELLLIYQGIIIPNRGLAELVAAMRDLPQCRLAIVGFGALEAEIRRQVSEEGMERSVTFFDPVPFDTLMRYTASADIGMIPLIGSCLSYRTAAPNKLFEYMMSGIPVVATDLPDMAAVINEVQCGELIAEPVGGHSIAVAVQRLLEGPQTPAEVGERGRQAAMERFNWETERTKLLTVFGSLPRRRP